MSAVAVSVLKRLNKQGRIAFLFLLGLLAIGVMTTSIESTLIAPSDLPFYLGLRIPLLLSMLPLAFVFRRNPYSLVGHFIFGSFIVAYCMHGQWYRPFYEYSFFQAMVFYTLMLYPPKRIFLPVLGFGSVLFMVVYAYRFDEVVLHTSTTLNENYLGIFAFAVTLYGIFKAFSEERAFKEQALARFGLLGKHSATILHDLKSTVAIPRIYTELAEEALDNGNIEKARAHLKETLTSLESMQNVIGQLNQMSQMTEFNFEGVDLREVVEEVRELFRVKLAAVHFELVGESRVSGSRSFVFSTILNLVMNSVEKFQKRETTNPAIKIELGAGRLIFEDNAGGFTADVLEKIESGTHVSTKAKSSGLGLYLLRDGIRNMGGKVSFSNSDLGARIQILFKT
nr:hypothetical protein [uncultured organism]